MVVVLMLVEGEIMVMVVMLTKKGVTVRVLMVKLTVNISSGPGSQTHSNISLDQENTR